MSTEPVGYLDIADHYRRLIADKTIGDGVLLPSIRNIAEEWGVATKTAQRALKSLCMEGYAMPIARRGYAAAYRVHELATLRVPVSGTRMRGEIYAPEDEIVIVSASMTATGGAVADVLGVEAGVPAVLRRGLVRRGDRIIRMSHSWFPPDLADAVPELLTTESTPPGSVARIERATGRKTVITADHMSVDLTSLHHAQTFGVPQNEPVLVRTTIRHDGLGVIEYGTTWFPRNVVLAVEYTDPNAPVE